MAIPDYETLMLPVLESLREGEVKSISDLANEMADRFNLTDSEREERTPHGKSTIITSRTHWARTYLKQAGLISFPQRGLTLISDKGREVLSLNLKELNSKFLERFPEFVSFKSRTRSSEIPNSVSSQTETPDELIERSYAELRAQLADELLDQIKNCSSDFFEQLVVDVVLSLGYGGTQHDAAKATQRTNDGGIDGIIKQDRLGLDTIYIQAKRWEAPIHRPEIQKFAGALQGVRSKKGIFITTSSFSEGAREYASAIDCKIILIDGFELAQLMIDTGIGVAPVKSYEIKRVDADYFVTE